MRRPVGGVLGVMERTGCPLAALSLHAFDILLQQVGPGFINNPRESRLEIRRCNNVNSIRSLQQSYKYGENRRHSG